MFYFFCCFWNRLDKRGIYQKDIEVCHIVKSWEGQRGNWDLENLQPRTWKPPELSPSFSLPLSVYQFHSLSLHMQQRKTDCVLSEIQQLLGKLLIGWPPGSDSIPDQSTSTRRVGSTGKNMAASMTPVQIVRVWQRRSVFFLSFFFPPNSIYLN